jgi:hypothetical protein
VLPVAEVLGKVPTYLPFSFRIIVYPAGAANLWFVWQVWRHIRNNWHPVAPRVALAHPKIPYPLRWISGGMWLCHSLLFIQVSFVPLEMDSSSFSKAVSSLTAHIVVRIAFAYAALTFLLLGVFAVTLRESTVHILWRHRWTIDAAIVVLCTAVSIIFKDFVDQMLQ